MSAKKSPPSYRYATREPIDLAADAPGVVGIITRLEQMYLEPFLDPNCQLDPDHIPEMIQAQKLLYEQYRLLCEHLGQYKCTLDVMLRSLCINYFRYGYSFALESDEDAEGEHFLFV